MSTDNFCFYLQNRLIQTSQTGGQLYSDTSPFSTPWLGPGFRPSTKLSPGSAAALKTELELKPLKWQKKMAAGQIRQRRGAGGGRPSSPRQQGGDPGEGEFFRPRRQIWLGGWPEGRGHARRRPSSRPRCLRWAVGRSLDLFSMLSNFYCRSSMK